MNAPFFLVGSERSGSTMLRLMLDHHPQLACNLESDFLVSHVDDAGTLPEIGAYRAFLTRDRVFRHSRFEVDESLGYQDLVASFLEQKRARDAKQRVGATVHHDFHRLPFLWPEARFVYLLRDGRDVANSAVGMGWAGNAYCGADIWIEAEGRWAEMRARLDPEAYIEVRFEDLVADPERTLARVCRFLGVPYDERMLAYPQTTTYGAPDVRLASQWRGRMDPRTRARVEARIGERLAQRGYPLAGDVPPPIGRGTDLLLRLESRLGCLRDRITRYGLSLTLEEFTARRLGLRRWQASAQLRCDAIIDHGLK
jgi:hypothetical protein